MHPNITLILSFFGAYFLLYQYFRSACYRDPTSRFFQPERASAPTYSTHRIRQAVEYADSAGLNLAETQRKPKVDSTNPPDLCIGIPSVHREGMGYLKPTLGSLQQGLSPEERSRLHFVVFLAHVDQKQHEDYNQPWLLSMADTLSAYPNPDVAELMVNQNHGTKSKFDYSLVMDECERTGAPYIMMLEDDVVFVEGWWPRVSKALETATSKTWSAGYKDFLYLRLFYYEGLQGWDSVYWRTYVAWSTFVTIAVASLSLYVRRRVPASRRYLTYSGLFLIVGVFTPLSIALYFIAGRNCVAPRPAGVNLMPDHACCGQGFVFPRDKVTDELLPSFRRHRWSTIPTDSFIERHADNTGALRWALTPVVMQHIGGWSSHNVNRGGGVTPARLWNFGFEQFDASRLTREHKLVARDNSTLWSRELADDTWIP
ncbi:integral membrane protein [Xylariaceae sp. FL1272]|nr:integral membrane protein [Xylariaceae sp. FL1272]